MRILTLVTVILAGCVHEETSSIPVEEKSVTSAFAGGGGAWTQVNPPPIGSDPQYMIQVVIGGVPYAGTYRFCEEPSGSSNRRLWRGTFLQLPSQQHTTYVQRTETYDPILKQDIVAWSAIMDLPLGSVPVSPIPLIGSDFNCNGSKYGVTVAVLP